MSQARRMAHIQPFHVMALLARARALEAQGHDIVHMEIGEPDFPTPAPIVAAGQRALAAGLTQYTPALGLPELRAAISDFYREQHGVVVDPGRIVVTPGASGALHLVLALLVDRDQQVLLTDPGYPCNRNFVHLVEGEPVGVPVDAATGYQLTAAMAEQHWTEHTRLLMVASPANPTGTLLAQAELAALQQLAQARGARLVVDEIYHGLTYDSDAPTALAVSDELFVINSFSKYFGMTGWRLGWIVAPPDQVEGLERLAQNLYLAAPTLSQHAALVAFTPETRAILEERRAAFQARRDYLLPALRELGFVIPVTPRGAFYLYADCSRFTDDSFAFSRQLLEEAGVAITPGRDFGEHRASQHVRFAYTTDIPRLQEGVERIRRFVTG
ncbi:MAG: pyridoxal phosphate-dependent aminotransferase [Gammaproteobacteria bacterium]|nr:pyridoxal phosphate-dependent aminotransferase [Gammaproteobacteria bacterium]